MKIGRRRNPTWRSLFSILFKYSLELLLKFLRRKQSGSDTDNTDWFFVPVIPNVSFVKVRTDVGVGEQTFNPTNDVKRLKVLHKRKS